MFNQLNLRSALIAFLSCLCVSHLSYADDLQRIEIPAGELTVALQALAKQTGLELVYQSEQLKGLKTIGLSGKFSPADAVNKLLQGTGLELTTDSTGAMLIATPHGHAPSTRLSPSAAEARLAQSGTQNAEPQAVPDSSPFGDNQGPTVKDSEHPALEEVVVTGTNIRGVENKTVPLLTFDRDAIDRSGYATTEDFIDSLPQNVKSGGNSADGVLSGLGLQNIENSTGANLRGLGSNSTLTLLNGHRVAPSSYGTGVDLSMIPLSAVERIEVLTDGSSAVYGSDAVGGVINIILREDFSGQETSARFDTLTEGGGEQKQIGQTVGRTWNTGSALAVLQFQDADAIRSDQRTFTAILPQPTDIYPASTRYSGIFSGHQSLSASLELFSDVLVAHEDSSRAYNTGGGVFAEVQQSRSKTDSQSANVGLRWQPFGDWHLEGDALYSQVNTNVIEHLAPLSFGYTNGAPYVRNLDTIQEGDIKLDGTLWASGGTSIKGAVGGSYRGEDFSSLIEFLPLDRPVDRHIRAAFAEVYAPLISSENAIALVKKLELSAAVRNDRYSDFGSKTNPRFGVFWSPVDRVGLRVAYSTSFREPNPSEIVGDLTSTNLFVQNGYPLPNDPNGNGNVLFFGNKLLGPESSRNISAGLDYDPAASTRLTLNYYRITYSNRIISAPEELNVFVNPQIYGPLIKQFPNDAAVDAFVASLEPPQTLVDFTPGGTGLAGVRFGFPYGYINAAKVSTQGFDLGSHSLLSLTARDKLIFVTWTSVSTVEINSTDMTSADPRTDRFERNGDRWEAASSAAAEPTKQPAQSAIQIETRQTLNRPPQVFAVDRASGESRLVLDPDPDLLERFKLGRVERISGTLPSGLQWLGQLIYPADYVAGRRYPLVIQSTYGKAWDPEEFTLDGSWGFSGMGLGPSIYASYPGQLLATRGIAVLELEVLHPSQGPQQAEDYQLGFETLAEQLSSSGLIDRNKIALVGFSRNGYWVEFTLAHSKFPFAAAVAADNYDPSYFQSALANWRTDDAQMNGATAFGEGLQQWIARAPGFNAEHMHAPLRMIGQSAGIGLIIGEWEIYSRLRHLKRPVEMYMMPGADKYPSHTPQNPRQIMGIQEGVIDWLSFWLTGREDPSPQKREQYERWQAYRAVQAEAPSH